MNAAVAGNDHELERLDNPYIAAVEGGERGFVLNDSIKVMKALSSMLFGNVSGNNDGEAFSLGIEVYSNDGDGDGDGDSDENKNDDRNIGNDNNDAGEFIIISWKAYSLLQ